MPGYDWTEPNAVRPPGLHDCPGHVGRGLGAECSICGGWVPLELRRTEDSPSEIRRDCRGCQRGTPHTH
jgi:hypothetical protein